MEIMGTAGTAEKVLEEKKEAPKEAQKAAAAPVSQENSVEDQKDKEEVFSEKNIAKDSVVPFGDGEVEFSITPADKAAFIDAVATNERFTKEYSLFGGKLRFILRSLTSDEVNALATWTARRGAEDPSGLVSGRYRKYLLAAHVAMLNGIEMPPLEEPLYERIGKDGKTVEPPGWTHRSAYWDSVGFGQFSAVLKCVSDFDRLYSALCQKASDENFWAPDTP